MRHTYSHIDLDERRKIARWRMAGISVEIIAEKLGRHRSTIFRELKRNMFVDKLMPDLNGYYCVTAHDMACERRAKLRKLAECCPPETDYFNGARSRYSLPHPLT